MKIHGKIHHKKIFNRCYDLGLDCYTGCVGKGPTVGGSQVAYTTAAMAKIAREMADQPRVAGRWFPSPQETVAEWQGVCGKCGATRDAIQLELKILPFGRGQKWVCKGGC